MSFGRRALTVLVFPVILGGSLSLAAAGLQAGVGTGWIVFGLMNAVAILLLGLQRVHPYRVDWKVSPSEFGMDVAHAYLSTAAVSALVEAVCMGLLVTAATYLSASFGASVWPSEWALAWQVVLAAVVGEFGAYWIHRLAHERPLLWRIHALHHTPERLYTLSAGRTHPINVCLSYGVQTAPLVVLGAGSEVLVLLSVLIGVHGLLQHANVKMATRAWSWVFSTASVHRWHHSTIIAESNANYGSTFSLWDWIFRTRFLPAEPEAPEAVGIPGIDMPESYLGQLAIPFRWRRFAGPDTEST
jgi:sterol desaturase/sphingolipid hydroxylase (fatty acid hydroxylase superfamily)